MSTTDWVLLLLEGFVYLVLVGWFAAAVLGVRQPFGRRLLAALVGLLITAGMFTWLFAERQDPYEYVIFLGIDVLATMASVLALDLLWPYRPGDRSWPRRAARWVRLHVGVLTGARSIAAAARHNGLIGTGRKVSRGQLTQADLGRSLKGTLEDAGGLFVKFGQVAAGNPMVPPAIAHELEDLRSSVRPVPSDEVALVLQQELGTSESELFASIEPKPIAAASIGQTHRAVLKDGTPVIVKVQRPDVGDAVDRDARVLRWASHRAERHSDVARRMEVTELVDEVIDGLRDELDFQREAANADLLASHSVRDVGIAVPRTYVQHSTRRVLVQQRVDGHPISDTGAVDAVAESAGVSRAELATRLVRSFIRQIVVDGAFHADPHPGNILIDDDATLWLIDFGAVGYLDPLLLDALQTMVLGFSTNDTETIARGIRDLVPASSVDLHALKTDVARFMSENLRTGGFGPQMFEDMVLVMNRQSITPPRALTLLVKAMVTLEGTVVLLDPDADLAALGMSQLTEMLGSGDLVEPRAMLQREALRALPSLRTLPGHTEEIARRLESGTLTVRVDRFAGADRQVVSEWLGVSLLAFIGGVGLLSSSLLLFAAVSSESGEVRDFLLMIGWFGLVVATVIVMRSAAMANRQMTRRRRRG